MNENDLLALFSKARLSGYLNHDEHRQNILLIGDIAPKLGIIEIVTRNKVAKALNITDDIFISRQTLGYWVELLNMYRIQNKIVNFKDIDFLKYSKFNKKHKWLNFEKTSITFSLIRTIRNRAFHFENLYKLNENSTPRLSTKLHGQIIGIEPNNINAFLDDILTSFDDKILEYLKGGG